MVTFILGRGVMRRATRVLLLLALDFVGVMGAIYTALLLKTLLHGNFNSGGGLARRPIRRSRSRT